MWVFFRYFRQHPWQRWVLTLLLAAIVGVMAAWIAWPMVRDRQILRLLGSADRIERERGIQWASHVSPRRPALVGLLERRLDEGDDSRFAAIAEVLVRVGRFNAECRSGDQLDRYAVISLVWADGAAPRLTWLHQLILGGRDNPHVRRALKLAAGDEAPQLRAAAALLAARVHDDATLLALLDDGDPAVRTAAALDAALAGRKALIDAIAARTGEPQLGDQERAAFAFALAKLSPRQHGARVAALIDHPWIDGQDALLQKMLCAAPLLSADRAGRVVLSILRDSGRRKQVPPAMAFVAAGKMKLQQARPIVIATIDDMIARRKELTVGEAATLAAAVNAAHRLEMPPELFTKVIEKLWHPGTSLAMLLAAEALGERDEAAGSPKALAILQAAAEDDRMPLPAAAAAVALFKLDPQKAREPLRAVCESETYLAGDYVAWHLGRWGQPQARQLAEEFFAPHVYDNAVRSTGALLLAMLSRGTDRAGEAERAIEGRLIGGALGGERNPFVAGAYRCGLMMLGRKEFAEEVLILQASDTFPKRRALTALLLGGHAAGFDQVLGLRRFDPAEADSYLTGRLMARVYSALAPDLPVVDVDAPLPVRHWQGRALRDYYLIRRRAILDRMSP